MRQANMPTTTVCPPTPNGLVHAITSVMAEIQAIGKQGYNSHFNYNYVKMPDLLRQLTPLMAQHGLVLFQSEISRNIIEDILAIEFEFTIRHTSGEEQKLHCTGMCKFKGKDKTNDKSAAAAATHARKYALIAMFGCVCDDLPDTDVDAATGAPKTLNKRQGLDTFQRLSVEIQGITNLGDLQQWGHDNGIAIATLPQDWQSALRFRYGQKLAEFRPPEQPAPNNRPKTVGPSPRSKLDADLISQRALAARNRRLTKPTLVHTRIRDDMGGDGLPDHSARPKEPVDYHED